MLAAVVSGCGPAEPPGGSGPPVAVSEPATSAATATATSTKATPAKATPAATPAEVTLRATPGEVPAPAQRTPSPPGPVATAAPAATPPAAPKPPAADDDHADPASITVVVNKRRPLNPVDYAPADLVFPQVPLVVTEANAVLRPEAAGALQDMVAAAAADGVGLTLVSGYRSYADQVATYNHWVAQNGGNTAAADNVSARPGYSEHQTGLALDLGQTDGACTLSLCFRDTAAGAWAADNAHRFGFILRYPQDFHQVTGFFAESWHYRYVGLEVAEAMRNSATATLEEHFGLPAAPDYG